jgi:hypothetical protein
MTNRHVTKPNFRQWVTSPTSSKLKSTTTQLTILSPRILSYHIRFYRVDLFTRWHYSGAIYAANLRRSQSWPKVAPSAVPACASITPSACVQSTQACWYYLQFRATTCQACAVIYLQFLCSVLVSSNTACVSSPWLSCSLRVRGLLNLPSVHLHPVIQAWRFI